MDTMNFRIDTEDSKVYLNGEDITRFCKGVSFIQYANDTAQLGIEFSHRVTVLAEGPMALQNLVNTSDDSAAAKLKGLDWQKLKDQALEGTDFETDPMDALLNVVVEALNGTES